MRDYSIEHGNQGDISVLNTHLNRSLLRMMSEWTTWQIVQKNWAYRFILLLFFLQKKKKKIGFIRVRRKMD